MKYLAIAALLSVFTVTSSAQTTEPLAEHRWKHRLLIAFANASGDSRAAALRTSLAAAKCELDDRDLVIGWVLSEETSRIGEAAMSDESAGVLRSGLRIQPGEFAVLLVGKDGGVKARYTSVPDLSEIFGLIDGMPMRRSEMRSSRAECAP